MPSDRSVLIALIGTIEYREWLDGLVGRLGLPNRAALAEMALAEFGERHQAPAPERAAPIGTNRHGRPKGSASGR